MNIYFGFDSNRLVKGLRRHRHRAPGLALGGVRPHLPRARKALTVARAPHHLGCSLKEGGNHRVICHIVFYRMKPQASEEDKDKLAEQARSKLCLVPGIKNLRAGKTINASGKGYSVALAMDFQDEAALESYRVDPDHQRFVKEIAAPMVEEVWRFDFRWD
jgi:hypothetical protein